MSEIKHSNETPRRPIESIVEHQIRIRAFELFQDRGGLDGHATEDWLQAESEVLSERRACGSVRSISVTWARET